MSSACTMPPLTQISQKTYYVAWYMYFIHILVFTVFSIAFILGFLGDMIGDKIVWLVVIIDIFVVLYLRGQDLTVTDDGLEFRGIFKKRFIRFEEIKSIRSMWIQRGRGSNHVYRIYLKNPRGKYIKLYFSGAVVQDILLQMKPKGIKCYSATER